MQPPQPDGPALAAPPPTSFSPASFLFPFPLAPLFAGANAESSPPLGSSEVADPGEDVPLPLPLGPAEGAKVAEWLQVTSLGQEGRG